MRHSLFLPAATLASALLLGCGGEPVPSEPANLRPSFRTEQNPDGPGAFVIIGPEFAFFESDPAVVAPPPNYTLMIGWTLPELLDFCATGEPTLSDIQRLLVFRPHGTEELPDLHTIFHGAQLPLLVWDTAIPFIDPFGELCDLAENHPHMEGTGQVISTDNDVFVTGNRADAFHTLVNGQVTSESGDRFRVSARFRGNVLPSGEVRLIFDFDLDQIR
jgi:hypothetical protein